MRYKAFECFASTPDGDEVENKQYFCEIYSAYDEGMADLLDCFLLKVGQDIPADSDVVLISALQKYVDDHYDDLISAVPEKYSRNYHKEILANTDFNLLYEQKQAKLLLE